MDESIFTHVEIRQLEDYRVELDFGADFPPVIADEPPPVSSGLGPSPVQLLTAAVGNCLHDSLLFALRKYKQTPEPLRTEARARVARNAGGRWRVLDVEVEIRLGVPAGSLHHLDRALSSVQSFCTVSQSVAPGISVRARVVDSEGLLLMGDRVTDEPADLVRPAT